MDTIILILTGAAAGWLASKIMRLESNPLINILLGVIGSMLGDAALGMLGISLGLGLLGDVLVAFGGAVILVLGYKLLSK